MRIKVKNPAFTNSNITYLKKQIAKKMPDLKIKLYMANDGLIIDVSSDLPSVQKQILTYIKDYNNKKIILGEIEKLEYIYGLVLRNPALNIYAMQECFPDELSIAKFYTLINNKVRNDCSLDKIPSKEELERIEILAYIEKEQREFKKRQENIARTHKKNN